MAGPCQTSQGSSSPVRTAGSVPIWVIVSIIERMIERCAVLLFVLPQGYERGKARAQYQPTSQRDSQLHKNLPLTDQVQSTATSSASRFWNRRPCSCACEELLGQRIPGRVFHTERPLSRDSGLSVWGRIGVGRLSQSIRRAWCCRVMQFCSRLCSSPTMPKRTG